MSENGDKNGCVTWRALLGILVACLSGVSTAGWIAYQVHAAQPHAGTVGQDEFARHASGVDSRMGRMEDKLDKIWDSIRSK